MAYAQKTYGRNEEVDILYKLFDASRDVSMHGPRRLGKTFLLDRLVDAAPAKGWTSMKIELAGCDDSKAAFRELCKGIGNHRSGGARAKAFIAQRLSQFTAPRHEAGGSWYHPLITLDHEAHFERIIAAMHDDKERRWLLLIDELPIFLKALHDKGTDGIAAARSFMNQVSRLRQAYPAVRWMITGSIGIEPLAQAGSYMGVLAKFETFHLNPLTEAQAISYVQDLATEGRLLYRQEITDAEAQALTQAVGWRAAYYLDALAQKLDGPPAAAPAAARLGVEAAVAQLVKLSEASKFGTWEEHLRKHYNDAERSAAFSVLGALAKDAHGSDIDGLLASIQQPGLTREALRKVLMRLDTEGFIAVDDWEHESVPCRFLNPLLRLWWRLSKPTQ